MNYSTIDKVRKYLLIDIVEDYEPTVEGFIAGVSRSMDQMANRKLVADPVESGDEYPTAYYDGTGRNDVFIDDFVYIDKVEVGDRFGDNLVEISNFKTYPAQSPFKTIIRKDARFERGIQNVAVSGLQGLFETLPDDISLACTIITGGIILNQTMSGHAKTMEAIGNYKVAYRTDAEYADLTRAMEIINSYRRQTF